MGLEMFQAAPIGYVFKLKYNWSSRHHMFLLKTGEDRLYRIDSKTPKSTQRFYIEGGYGFINPESTLLYYSRFVTNPPKFDMEDLLWD